MSNLLSGLIGALVTAFFATVVSIYVDEKGRPDLVYEEGPHFELNDECIFQIKIHNVGGVAAKEVSIRLTPSTSPIGVIEPTGTNHINWAKTKPQEISIPSIRPGENAYLYIREKPVSEEPNEIVAKVLLENGISRKTTLEGRIDAYVGQKRVSWLLMGFFAGGISVLITCLVAMFQAKRDRQEKSDK